MTAQSAVVRMRYRPSGDVLLGQVEPAEHSAPPDVAVEAGAAEPAGPAAAAFEVAEQVEQLDADTSLTWRAQVHGPYAGRWLLQGFEVLGAGARLGQGQPFLESFLFERLGRTAQEMIVSATAAAASLTAEDRVRARAEAEVEIPIEVLLRPSSGGLAPPVSAEPADLGATRSLTAALVHLADVVDTSLAQRRTGRPATEPHAARFVSSLRTFASVISRHRLPAPGAAAAVIDTVRGGLPLSGPERAQLRHALRELDQVHTWRAAARSIETLAASLEAGPSPSGRRQQ